MNLIEINDSKDINLSNKIDITITSPPYGETIDYSKHREDENYSHNSTDIEEFIEKQYEIFKEVWENTKEGGYCCVVIGMCKKNNDSPSKVALPHRFATMMEKDIGWDLHESIVWYKVGSGSNRFGTTIQHPYPGYYYPNQMHEEIQIWIKGDITHKKIEEEKLNIRSDFVEREVSNNIWHIPPVPTQKYHNLHPCPFPEEIPYRLIRLYSNKNDFVFDPMAGLGTTIKVAKNMDRNCLGYEISKEYAEAARERIEKEEFNRDEQLVPKFIKEENEFQL